MSIDCANGAVIFFTTSHCLFPILNENSYLIFLLHQDQPCSMYCSGPWLPGEAALEKWEHLSAAHSPSGACTQLHHRCLQAVLEGLT